MNINSNDKHIPFLSSSKDNDQIYPSSQQQQQHSTTNTISFLSSSSRPSSSAALLCSGTSVLRIGCPRKRRVALVDRFELDAWQRWRKYRVFPRSLILHLCTITIATMMVVLFNTSTAGYSYDAHNALTSILFPADEPNWNGNGLTYPGDEYFLHSIDKVNQSFFAIMTNYFGMDYRSFQVSSSTSSSSSSFETIPQRTIKKDNDTIVTPSVLHINDLDGPFGPMDYIECYPAPTSSSSSSSSSPLPIAVPSLSYTILPNSRYQTSEYYTVMMNYLAMYQSNSNDENNNKSSNSSIIQQVRIVTTNDDGSDEITVSFPTLDLFNQWVIQTIPDDASTTIFFQSLGNLQYNLQLRTYNLAKGSTTGSTCMLWTFTIPFELTSHGVTRIYAIDDFIECDGGGWNGPEATGGWNGVSPLLMTGLLMVLLAIIQQGTLIRQDARIMRLMRWTVILGQTTRYFAHAHLRIRAIKVREQCIALGIPGADKLPQPGTHSRYNIRKFRLRLSCLSFFLTCCGCRKDHHHHLHQDTTIETDENNVPILHEEHYADDIEINDDTSVNDILPLTGIINDNESTNNVSSSSSPNSHGRNWKQRIVLTNDTTINNKDIQNVQQYQETREQNLLEQDIARIKRFLEAYIRSGATQKILFSDYLDILSRRSSSSKKFRSHYTKSNNGNLLPTNEISLFTGPNNVPVMDSSVLNDAIGLADDIDDDNAEEESDQDDTIIRRYSMVQVHQPTSFLSTTGSINNSGERRSSNDAVHTQSTHSIHSTGSTGGMHGTQQPLRSLAYQAALNEKQQSSNNANLPRSRRASIVLPNQQIMSFPVSRSRVNSQHDNNNYSPSQQQSMGSGLSSTLMTNVSSALTTIAAAQQQRQSIPKDRQGLPPRPTKQSSPDLLNPSESLPNNPDRTDVSTVLPSLPPITLPTYTFSPLQKALQKLSTTTIHVHHSHALELLSPWTVFKTIGNICTGLFASIMLISGKPLLGKNLTLLLALGGALEWISLMQYLKHHGSFYLFSRMFNKGIPSIMRNMLATVPIFVAFMIVACMIFGNLTERFDGVQWASIALFAVANGDVVRETFQVTLQYQDSVITRLLAQIFMYAYTASFIYVMLKTTTAITEEAFLLTRPPPKDLTPDSKVYAIPGVQGIKQSDFVSVASSRSSMIDGDDESSHHTGTTVDKENSAIEEYRLPDQIRQVLIAMQFVRDQGGAIAPLITACTEFASLSAEKQASIIQKGWLPFSMNALTKKHTVEQDTPMDYEDTKMKKENSSSTDGSTTDDSSSKSIAVPLQQLMNLMGRILQGGTDEENERQLLGPGPNHFYNELYKQQKKNTRKVHTTNPTTTTNEGNGTNIDITNSINASINSEGINGRNTSLELSERPKSKSKGNNNTTNHKNTAPTNTAKERRTSGNVSLSSSSNSSRYGSFDQNDPTLRRGEKVMNTYQPPKV